MALSSQLTPDRIALSWYCLESLSPGEATKLGKGQMGPDKTHANIDEQRQLGHELDADAQQRQARAFACSREPDPRRRFCHRLPHRRPQDQGHADQVNSAARSQMPKKC
jgi:hypothetical protein